MLHLYVTIKRPLFTGIVFVSYYDSSVANFGVSMAIVGLPVPNFGV